jgi:hypothetical protein
MKNRIFKDSPFFDEAVQMPVDKDVLAFRMRQRNDFACSCSGTEIIHEANSESLNLFAGPQTRLRGADTWVDDQPGSRRGSSTAPTDGRVLSTQINGIDREPGSVIDTGNSNAVSLCWE